MSNTISIEDFLRERDRTPVIDVRSPSEYAKAHIPGAYSIPLFTDVERAVVGTKYTQQSRIDSVIAGLEFVGPKLGTFVQQAREISPSGDLLVYCWRGGMRSASMTWLLNLAGFKARALVGGYRAYRRYARQHVAKPFRLIVLAGMTGSGKTELLSLLSQRGEQVIDLEALANHKGSAFGWIGQSPQPSTEQFENLVFEALHKLNRAKPIWVEDESKSIGSVFIPDVLFDQMADSPTISVELPLPFRVTRLSAEYTNCNPQYLIESVNRIAKRLGRENAQRCVCYISEGKFEKAIEITLQYYDKTYRYGLEQKKRSPHIIEISDNPHRNLELLLHAKRAIVL